MTSTPGVLVDDNVLEVIREAQVDEFTNKFIFVFNVRRFEHFSHVRDKDMQDIGMQQPQIRQLREQILKMSREMWNRSDPKQIYVQIDQSTPVQSSIDENALIPNEQIKVYEMLGEGSFAVVKRGVWMQGSGQKVDVAVKILRDISPNIMENLRVEASHLLKLQHPSLIRLYGIVRQPAMMVFELCEGGSLLDRLRDGSKPVLLVSRLQDYCIQIAKALLFLESKHCVHRDVAARNILVAKDEKTVKICDFGLMRVLKDNEQMYTMAPQKKVPFAWCPPEALRHQKFSHASDVWSYGVTIWEMFTFGEEPWVGCNAIDVLKNMDAGERLEKPKHCSQRIYQIMQKCWKSNPAERCKFSEIREDLKAAMFLEAVAREAFNSIQPGMLQLVKNDEVVVVENTGEDWFGQCKKNQKFGFFPRTVVFAQANHAVTAPLAVTPQKLPTAPTIRAPPPQQIQPTILPFAQKPLNNNNITSINDRSSRISMPIADFSPSTRSSLSIHSENYFPDVPSGVLTRRQKADVYQMFEIFLSGIDDEEKRLRKTVEVIELLDPAPLEISRKRRRVLPTNTADSENPINFTMNEPPLISPGHVLESARCDDDYERFDLAYIDSSVSTARNPPSEQVRTDLPHLSVYLYPIFITVPLITLDTENMPEHVLYEDNFNVLWCAPLKKSTDGGFCVTICPEFHGKHQFYLKVANGLSKIMDITFDEDDVRPPYLDDMKLVWEGGAGYIQLIIEEEQPGTLTFELQGQSVATWGIPLTNGSLHRFPFELSCPGKYSLTCRLNGKLAAIHNFVVQDNEAFANVIQEDYIHFTTLHSVHKMFHFLPICRDSLGQRCYCETNDAKEKRFRIRVRRSEYTIAQLIWMHDDLPITGGVFDFSGNHDLFEEDDDAESIMNPHSSNSSTSSLASTLHTSSGYPELGMEFSPRAYSPCFDEDCTSLDLYGSIKPLSPSDNTIGKDSPTLKRKIGSTENSIFSGIYAKITEFFEESNLSKEQLQQVLELGTSIYGNFKKIMEIFIKSMHKVDFTFFIFNIWFPERGPIDKMFVIGNLLKDLKIPANFQNLKLCKMGRIAKSANWFALITVESSTKVKIDNMVSNLLDYNRRNFTDSVHDYIFLADSDEHDQIPLHSLLLGSLPVLNTVVEKQLWVHNRALYDGDKKVFTYDTLKYNHLDLLQNTIMQYKGKSRRQMQALLMNANSKNIATN